MRLVVDLSHSDREDDLMVLRDCRAALTHLMCPDPNLQASDRADIAMLMQVLGKLETAVLDSPRLASAA